VQINIFDCVSPLDFRYYGPDLKLRERLAPYVSERGRLQSELRVEATLVAVLEERGLCPPGTAAEVAAATDKVTVEDWAAEDARIHHETRALVNCLQRQVSAAARPFIHFTLTSFDVKDTAAAWRFRRLAEKVLVPDLLELERVLIELALREKDTLQIGRTHGQHAEPITFGFALSGAVSRLAGRIAALQTAAQNLRGKISGAVGAYNAGHLFFEDPEQLERDLLARLGLEPSPSSTQIVEPEFLADYVHALVTTFGVLADLADDMRHLQRTEIAEVGEAFEQDQVGSSTMPHKRNPWNFEHVKSMWKAFMPRIVTVYADQLSEHQRDLTNSASARFVPEMAVALAASVVRLRRQMSRLVTDPGNMRRNFELTAGLVVAEPAYILLAAHGHPDAHEAIRKLTQQAQTTGKGIVDLLQESDELRPYWERFTPAQREILASPEEYTGIAAEKTVRICTRAKEALGIP